MNHTKKKSGVPDKASGTPLCSVCGILCGQQNCTKSYSAKKVVKNKRKHPKSEDFRCYSGAAGRIRTADLILTKDALYLLSYSSSFINL